MKMDFAECLRAQMALHPAMQPLDVLKLCYQAASGAEHLLTDADRARAYFDREFAATTADASQPLFEPISDRVARINIAAWKAATLPPEWLFRMFVHTATLAQTADLLEDIVAQAAELCAGLPGWDDTLSAWRDAGMPAVHHSEAYRAAEHPAYRIVRREYCALLPVLTQLAADPATKVDAALVPLLRDVLGEDCTLTADAASRSTSK